MKIWIIDNDDLDTLRAHVNAAVERGTYFRIAAYGDALKVKAGEGMWTWGIGQLDVEFGSCDTCSALYDTGSRDGRCGDCGECEEHCTHETYPRTAQQGAMHMTSRELAVPRCERCGTPVEPGEDCPNYGYGEEHA